MSQNTRAISPAAQAVLDALMANWQADPFVVDVQAVAASLRAVADQVRMEEPLGDTDADVGVFAAHHAICAAILAIAAEIEAWYLDS
jgi:hypothetical protein